MLVCRTWSLAASSTRVWRGVLLRRFTSAELPQDLGFLDTCTTQQLQQHYHQLRLQRPAALSAAPRTCELKEHAQAHFPKVLHIDGRRDLNFSSVFSSVPPGDYHVVWRVLLQPGFVRGYSNFRVRFALPPKAKSTSARGGRSTRGLDSLLRLQASQQQAATPRKALDVAELRARGGVGRRVAAMLLGRAGGVQAGGVGLRWPGCGAQDLQEMQDVSMHGAGQALEAVEAAEAEAAAAGLEAAAAAAPAAAEGAGAPQEILPALPQLAAIAVPPPPAAAAGPDSPRPALPPPPPAAASSPAPPLPPRFVPGCVSLVWGGYSSSWKQLCPASGPATHGQWTRVHLGSLTVRRTADVHLHNVLVQLRGQAPHQQVLPPGEAHWRGALVDYVELVPAREQGVLEGMLPAFVGRRHVARELQARGVAELPSL